jgi:HPt (histidine-containing phosphotransfer) domain-containing protein
MKQMLMNLLYLILRKSLSNKGLIRLQQSNASLQDESEEDVMVSPPPTKVLELKSLASILQKADELIHMIEQEDRNAERSLKVCTGIVKELACYKALHE